MQKNIEFLMSGDELIKYCGKDKNVVIPEGVRIIGSNAFKGKKSLYSITISNTVEKIDISAFEGCINLSKVEFSAHINAISSYAFKDCVALENITIPESVEHIGDCAFWGCKNLKKLVFPLHLTSVSAHVFRECFSLEELILPDNLEIFYCQRAPRELTLCNNAPKLKYNKYKNALYLGSVKNPYLALISITDRSVSKFTIHQETKVIVNNAFEKCRFLKDIRIPHGVKYIYTESFKDCRSLKKVEIPESVEMICDGAFSGCNNLESICLPNNLSRLGNYAFENCFRLKEVIFPKELESIGVSAFSNCYSLEDVTIPEGVTELFAFSQCYSLRNVVLPEGIIKLGGFQDCELLKELRIPMGLKEFSISHFEGCYELSSLILPETIECVYKGLGTNEFVDQIFKTVEYKNGKYIGTVNNPYHVLYEVIDKKCQNFEFHNDTKVIVESAFSGCNFLTELIIIEGIISIGYRAFQSCKKLKKISFPNSIKRLGVELLEDCPAMEEILISDDSKFDFTEALSCSYTKLNYKTIIYNNAKYFGTPNNPYHTLLEVVDTKCEELQIQENTKIIGWRIFGGKCSPVKKVCIPESVCFINKSAFEGCRNVELLAPKNDYAKKLIKNNELIIW